MSERTAIPTDKAEIAQICFAQAGSQAESHYSALLKIKLKLKI